MHRKLKAGPVARMIMMLIPTVIGLVFVFYMAVRTFAIDEVRHAVTRSELSAGSLSDLTENFEDVLEENIYLHDQFVNLNGLTTRALGINTLNKRYKLANGYLVSSEGLKDTSGPAEALIELNEFLTDRDIGFLYIMAPSKEAFYDAEYAPGYGSDAWMNIDAMVDALDEAGVNCLDMDAWFEENGWTMEDTFFRTDHHWLPEAAFAAAQCTMEVFSEQGLADYDGISLSEENWTVTVYEDWFLGSSGKRTGTTYTGVDDFPLYIPDFSTDFSFCALTRNTTNWDYADSALGLSYLDGKNYFGENTYCVYMLHDYPIRISKNMDAPNDQRILVLGDSFRNPYEYFISTQFQEVYALDLRYYTDGTLAQYITELQPDLVVMCNDEGDLDDSRLFKFGTSDYLAALDATDPDVSAIELGDFAVTADEEQDRAFTVVTTDLEPGQTYTLTVDATAYAGGEDRFVQMTLQDLSDNSAVYNRYFDIDSDQTQTWIFTVPEGSDAFAVYFYAGTRGHTSGVSAQADGVRLYEGVAEDAAG